jgi:hypothetical protein
MPYEEHPQLLFDRANEKRLFRYTELDKFLALLSTSKLYFSTLGTMQDKYEGKLTNATKDKWRKEAGDKIDIVNGNIKIIESICRRNIYVSCWNINTTEDELLWSKFCSNALSICIVTSVERIIDAIKDEVLPIQIGQVEYVDFDNEILKEMNMFSICAQKSKYYKNENELRLFCLIGSTSTGIFIDVKTRELIEKVIISPKALGWRSELIAEIINKYNPEIKIESSEIKYW